MSPRFADLKNSFLYLQRDRYIIHALHEHGIRSLESKKILDIGCGAGNWLIDLESWGACRNNLAGIEINPARYEIAKSRLGSVIDQESEPDQMQTVADIRIGDASSLPWEDRTFDIIMQSTVFTSIRDDDMKKRIADEMVRVLKPDGLIVWYDFNYKGIGAKEIQKLFRNSQIKLKRITLFPPLSQKLVRFSWMLTMLLEKMTIMNTHYLGIIKKS